MNEIKINNLSDLKTSHTLKKLKCIALLGFFLKLLITNIGDKY